MARAWRSRSCYARGHGVKARDFAELIVTSDTLAGKLVSQPVAEAHELPYTDPAELFG